MMRQTVTQRVRHSRKCRLPQRENLRTFQERLSLKVRVQRQSRERKMRSRRVRLRMHPQVLEHQISANAKESHQCNHT
ncbi:hypothetical protein NQZ68_021822 [Dissostichus eleginoides]|nr:hypothetical protein NQZ68_021822 [Dissostichus eleginoides]